MERSDRTDGRRHSQAPARTASRVALSLAFLGVAGALAAGTGRLTLPASALDACPAGVAGALTIVSRPLVPVGATVLRGFTIEGTVSDVKLWLPRTTGRRRCRATTRTCCG